MTVEQRAIRFLEKKNKDLEEKLVESRSLHCETINQRTEWIQKTTALESRLAEKEKIIGDMEAVEVVNLLQTFNISQVRLRALKFVIKTSSKKDKVIAGLVEAFERIQYHSNPEIVDDIISKALAAYEAKGGK